ncbi:MAG: DUF4158 domain-containing protein [Solirubrobacteraceae bacterium]
MRYVAEQVGVDPAELGRYDWAGRSIKYHRAQIREALGFREAPRADEERLADWLADDVCAGVFSEERQREALLVRCRQERLEPPGRLDRILGAARRAADERFCQQTIQRLPEHTIARLDALVSDAPAGDALSGAPWLLAELKADSGRLGLESLLAEIAKLERVRALQLPVDLFADVSEARVAAWRTRAALEHPAWLRAHPAEVRLTLLACLCWSRVGEITDALIELFIGVVHKINTRAERKVERELLDDLRRVQLLFAIARPPSPTPRTRSGQRSTRSSASRRCATSSASQGQRPGVPGARADGAARLLLAPLPTDAATAARRPGVPLQQPRLPAGHLRAHAA